MVNENKKYNELSKNIEKNLEEFKLFTLPNDKMTQSIFEISNPFEFLLPEYIDKKLPNELNAFFDLSGENLLKLVLSGNLLKAVIFDKKKSVFYQPDFDKLSNETREKLESGIYKIGESKKVKGNMRSVIVDTENSNQRVEDLTLKEVKSGSSLEYNLSDVAIQVQLKQIYDVLLDIQEAQDYQLHWDRNNSIIAPFFTARTQIIEFQNSKNLEEKINLLKMASQSMENSVSSIKTDLISNRDFIEKLLNKPTYKYKTFEKHANFILSDINLLLKIVGMQIYIDLMLEKESMAIERFDSVKYIFESYSSRIILEPRNVFLNTIKKVPIFKNKKYFLKNLELSSMLEIIHDNYKYTSDNRDSWLKINDEMQGVNRISLLNEGD